MSHELMDRRDRLPALQLTVRRRRLVRCVQPFLVRSKQISLHLYEQTPHLSRSFGSFQC